MYAYSFHSVKLHFCLINVIAFYQIISFRNNSYFVVKSGYFQPKHKSLSNDQCFFQVVETYNTFGTETAPGDGTYYFTVVAYNRALDPSEPVCSDGVTIDSTVPGVKEVIISDAIITGGLVTDVNQSDFYILDSDRYRRTIKDSTPDCLYV